MEIVRELRADLNRELYRPDRLAEAVMSKPNHWPALLKIIRHDHQDDRNTEQ